MKMKYGIIGMIIIFLVVGLIWLYFRKKEVPITSIKKFRYHYTTGYAMNDDVFYELNCEKKCIIKIKQNGEREEEAHKISVKKEFIQELEGILKKYNVGTWNGFQKTNPNVLDGNSFSMNILFQDGTSIDASGYMSYPKHYRDVKKELNELFEKQL